ncbi:MAG: NTP transferase domain-containing protein [Thaumarchaeota archaeon]|nr:NTP transferase domain-containing protein [Nitrososphaerota archaeon]
MGQTSKCALIVADGKEADLLPGRFDSRDSKSTFLQYVLDSVWTVVDEILVVFAKEPKLSLVETIAPFGVKIAIDRNGSSILTRIAAGFKACNSENCFVLPTSSPFVKPNVVFQLFEELRSYDAAIPKWKEGGVEPLLAVYKKKPFLKAVTSVMGDDMEALIENLYAVTFVSVEDKLQPLDPELLSFFRVSNGKDLERAKSIATAEMK